jgi:hypothetical protein
LQSAVRPGSGDVLLWAPKCQAALRASLGGLAARQPALNGEPALRDVQPLILAPQLNRPADRPELPGGPSAFQVRFKGSDLGA